MLLTSKLSKFDSYSPSHVAELGIFSFVIKIGCLMFSSNKMVVYGEFINDFIDLLLLFH